MPGSGPRMLRASKGRRRGAVSLQHPHLDMTCHAARPSTVVMRMGSTPFPLPNTAVSHPTASHPTPTAGGQKPRQHWKLRATPALIASRVKRALSH
jgi:hypothetical protein